MTRGQGSDDESSCGGDGTERSPDGPSTAGPGRRVPEPGLDHGLSPEEIARDEADQLREPKVALAVVAVMALLIVIVLLATDGTHDNSERPSQRGDPASTTQQ
ncbi:hypothetical protein [Nocardia sp. NPDC019395]|uniref:hypothetical protein n=1 Tax=Nocardia sp. NPDC019395 TaxID=3154686 RepID=UPI00340B95AC